MLSPSPFRLQDEWITGPIVRGESHATGISVPDIGRRRLWLGHPGAKEKFTKDPDQEHAGETTRRQQRDLRHHEMLYSLRVFVSGDAGAYYDMPYDMPQAIVHQRDPRWPLQGYLQPVDERSWQRHSEVRVRLDAMGGPPPPRGSAASSSAGQPEEPAAELPERRARSRSPRRAKTIRASSKGPMPSAAALPTAMARKRGRSPSSAGSSSTPTLVGPPPKRQCLSRRVFTRNSAGTAWPQPIARPQTRPAVTTDEDSPVLTPSL